MKAFIKELKRVETFVRKQAATVIGTEAVNHFTENFDKQSFDSKQWKEVKRRDPASSWHGFKYGAKTPTPSKHPKRRGTKKKYKARKSGSITNFSPTATQTPILSSQRSELENSLTFRLRGSRKVAIISDKEYAKIHNEGGTIKIFGKRTAKIPARPFIGASSRLDKRLKKVLLRKLNIK